MWNKCARLHSLRIVSSLTREFRTTVANSRDITDILPEVERCQVWIPKTYASYGGRNVVTMMVGSGTGPELMNFVKDVFNVAHVPVDFEIFEVTNEDIMDEAIISLKRNGVGIKSNLEAKGTVRDPRSLNLIIRRRLDLYLHLIHFKPINQIPTSKFTNLDIVLIRQNTEGEYAMLEHESVKGVVKSLKIITRYNSHRIARSAFEFAKLHKRKKVTIVHKANIMKLTDGLFYNECMKVGKEYPNIQSEGILVDNCSMQLVTNLKQFDVLVMPNLYGNILVNTVCGLLGGAGLFGAGDYGQSVAIFEPAARSRGLIMAGKNEANPIAMLNTAVKLLYHLKKSEHAELIERAIQKTIAEDKVHTADLGGKATSTMMVDHIKNHIINMNPPYFSQKDLPPPLTERF